MYFQDFITAIDDSREDVSCLVLTEDPRLVNILRRSLLTEIPTYCIDVVSFDINSSPRPEEVIAFRLGQLVIDHDATELPLPEPLDIDVSGPGVFTSSDIEGLVCKYETPIVQLQKDQRIKCRIHVVRDIAQTHNKWCPVSGVSFQEAEGGYLLTFRNIGMLSSQSILEEGFRYMRRALARPPQTIFSRIQLPEESLLEGLPEDAPEEVPAENSPGLLPDEGLPEDLLPEEFPEDALLEDYGEE